jgi:hypothetical protein
MKRYVLCLSSFLALGGCAYQTESEPDSIEEVGSTSSEIYNAIGDTAMYSRGLLRLDLTPSGGCSAFLIGPNVIATAAHCVDDRVAPSPRGTWNGWNWGYVTLRMVYKPTQGELMCLNETCRDANGNRKNTTVLAWWHAGYSGEGDTGDDIAILTRVQGHDFPTRAADVDDPAPRALDGGDFLRLLASAVSTSEDGTIWGYGALSDSEGSDSNPRVGWVETNYWGPNHVRADADRESRICAGDSGGPLVYRPGVFANNFAAGIASNTDARNGDCPESGDAMRWTRVSSKIGMIDDILGWSGRDACQYATGSGVPGSSGYYRCW